MKFKNYLFDCGNVLFAFSKQLLLEVYVDNEKDWNTISDVVFKYWEMQDVGMSSEDFYDFVQEKLPERLHEAAYNIIFNWDLWIKPFNDMRDLIIRLKQSGHKVYAISNMPSVFSINHSKLPVLEFFDGLVFSYDVKTVKPDVKIFEICLENYKLNPEDCFFTDDLKANCDAAEKLGIKSYLFDQAKRDEYIQYIEELESL